MVAPRIGRGLVIASALAATALAAHTYANLRLLRRPSADAPEVTERVDVLIPARNEEASIRASVESALAQTGIEHLSVTVLDDDSSDATAAIVDDIAANDQRVRLTRGSEGPPPGWLGKPWACARLSENATGSVVVFLDADVELEPDALRGLVALLRENNLAMVAPYPRQLAQTWLERLVQPLVTWSWAATMPVRWAERSTRPSLSAANGQLIVMDTDAYRAAGGHGAVSGDVLEDIALMRAFKRAGLHTATVDGSHSAQCRMYFSTQQVVDGYAKSLWAAFDGPVGSIAINSMLVFVYVTPVVALVSSRDRQTRAWAMIGYGSGVISRALVARRFGDRVLPDSFAQPASIVSFVALNAISWSRHLRGTATWKGRPVTTA